MGAEDGLKAADEALACIATIGESRIAYEFNGNLDIIANTTSLSTASIKATVDDLKRSSANSDCVRMSFVMNRVDRSSLFCVSFVS
jgi:hypothetical protein